MTDEHKIKQSPDNTEKQTNVNSVSIELAEAEDSEEDLLSLEKKLDAIESSRELVRSDCFSDSYLSATNGGARVEDILARAAQEKILQTRSREITHPPSEALQSDKIQLQNVQGEDDRVLIQDVSKIPVRTIGLLKFETERGGTRYGTAWLIGPRTLVTAAHNLKHKNTGNTTIMHVGMSFDGNTALGGWHRIVGAEVPHEWNRNPEAENPEDYAVIKIADPGVGNTLGWLGFADYEDSKLRNMILNVFGYPMDKPGYNLYGSSGRVMGVFKDRITYDCDTGPGMSGGPVIASFNNSRIAVGIHVAGHYPCNYATRIDNKAFRFFKKFQSW